MAACRLMTLGGLVVACVLALGTGESQAAPLIYVDDNVGTIGTVDVATRSVTVIGPSGVVLTDIAFSPSQQLFGVDSTNLYSVNQTTGHATLIGSLAQAGVFMNGLVFASDGTLYASGIIAGPPIANGLFTVNTTTGQATQVGNSTLPGLFSAGDLAFVNGTLYETVNDSPFGTGTRSDLASLNLTTGAATDIGTIVNDPNMFGLVNANGTLIGVDGTNLYSINPTTGVGTLLGSFASQGLGPGNGAANALEAVRGVPEPGSVTLFGGGLLVLGLVRLASATRKRH